MELLKNIPNFQGIREDIISKLIDKIDECTYNMNDFIIRQYAKGDTFYIISKGRAKVTKSSSKWDTPKFVKYLNRGEYFGENALQGEETRAFNVVADDPNGVTCLVLDRQYYNQLVTGCELSNLKRVE